MEFKILALVFNFVHISDYEGFLCAIHALTGFQGQ